MNKVKIIDSLVIASFGLSIMTSKAGLYICSGLLLMRFFTLVFRGDISFLTFRKEPFYFMPFFIYLCGIAITILAGGSHEDIAHYARKGALLLVIPPLVFLLEDKQQRKVALISIVSGFLIASGYVMMKIVKYGWEGERISGFFDVGRWGEMLVYVILLTLPFAYNRSKTRSLLSMLIVLLGLVMLAISGSRAPMVALLILIPCFIFYKSRLHFLILSLLVIGTVVLLKDIYPETVNRLSSRIVSIADLESDPSNVARLKMWKTSLGYFADNIVNSPKTAILGNGAYSFEDSYIKYLTQKESKEYFSEITHHQFSFSDSHNMYIDMLNKQGMLYTMLLLMSLALAAYRIFWSNRHYSTELDASVILILFGFAIVGMFYTSAMDYQTSFIYLAISLVAYKATRTAS